MSSVGQIEKKTQARVVKLFREQFGYDYLGDWTEREGNRNIEEELLRIFLRKTQGYDEALITRALHLLDKAAGEALFFLHQLGGGTDNRVAMKEESLDGIGQGQAEFGQHFAVLPADGTCHVDSLVPPGRLGDIFDNKAKQTPP